MYAGDVQMDGPAIPGLPCAITCANKCGAGAGLALGTLSILLFNQWDHGSGRAFLVILMLIIPYLFYIAIKGFNAPQERNGLA